MKCVIERKLVEVQKKIDYYGNLARQMDGENFEHYYRQYVKAIAQYNILLEVLREVV